MNVVFAHPVQITQLIFFLSMHEYCTVQTFSPSNNINERSDIQKILIFDSIEAFVK